MVTSGCTVAAWGGSTVTVGAGWRSLAAWLPPPDPGNATMTAQREIATAAGLACFKVFQTVPGEAFRGGG